MKVKRQWSNIYNMQKKIHRVKFLLTEKLSKTSIKKDTDKKESLVQKNSHSTRNIKDINLIQEGK